MKDYRKFKSECSIKRVQNDYLIRLLKNNTDTEYGKKYDFGSIESYNDFIQSVPLTSYEDYESFIDKIAHGKKRILTAEDVKLFEPTSGSSGGRKLIPYTKSLQREFQAGIRPWLYDIYKNVDGVCTGKSYWSITPVTAGKSYTDSGIPIGFEDDSAYFGKAERFIMNKLFAVDSSVKFAESMKDFYFSTSLQLINCERLTLISVWNPTFLSILCEFIGDNAKELSEQLTDTKAESLKLAVSSERFDILFPDVKIISCWADGSAKDDLSKIKRFFPNVYIQPKGILATECFVSLPLVGEKGGRLSIYSHFFEFMRLTDGKIFTADRLEKGDYELIVTTGGGFYRYRIGDIIRVLEVNANRPPRICFIGRSGIACDLCGEKLTEEFVRGICIKLGIADNFSMLAPKLDYDCRKGYALYTDSRSISPEMLDNALRESFHYDYCRRLGQLHTAEVVEVSGEPYKRYLERLTENGMRLGDIKPSHLNKMTDWDKYLK